MQCPKKHVKANLVLKHFMVPSPGCLAYHKEESHLNIFCKTEQLQSYSLITGFRMTPPG